MVKLCKTQLYNIYGMTEFAAYQLVFNFLPVVQVAYILTLHNSGHVFIPQVFPYYIILLFYAVLNAFVI